MNEYIKSIVEKTSIKPKTILEIGSRDGNDSNILKTSFDINDEDVYIVEPNPNQQHYIKNKYPNFNLIPYAIFNKEGKLKFNAVNDKELIGISSLLNRTDNIYSNIDSSIIEVDVITGHTLMNTILNDIDICKIDVEGATYEVLESLGDKITTIKSMHVENEHKEVWVGQKLYDDVKKLLLDRGYVEIYFKYVNGVNLQSDSIWVLKEYVK